MRGEGEAGTVSTDRERTTVKEKDLSIFLLMGQSNMSGRGILIEVEPVEDRYLANLENGNALMDRSV